MKRLLMAVCTFACMLVSVNADNVTYVAPSKLDYDIVELSISNTSSPVSVSSQGHKPYGVVVKGNDGNTVYVLTKSNVEALLNSLSAQYMNGESILAGLCYVDFTNCVANETTTSSVGNGYTDFGAYAPNGTNANCLYYFPVLSKSGKKTSTQYVYGDNVVIGEDIEELKLTRDSNYPFCNKYSFYAKTVQVEGLPVTDNYVMVSLPFALQGEISLVGEGVDYRSGDVIELLRACEFTGIEDNTLSYTIITDKSSGLKANTPYLMNGRLGQSYSILFAYNVYVEQTEDKNFDTETFGSWKMGVTYQAVCPDMPTGSTTNFYGMSKNTFLKASSTATFKPFSGFMICEDGNASSAKMRIDNQLNTTTAIESLGGDGSELIVSTDGNMLHVTSATSDASATPSTSVTSSKTSTSTTSSKLVISSITGKVIYSGSISGTKTFTLPQGIYIVNGKKIKVNP